MQSPAKTVSQYLASLPADRRATIESVRKVIRANLDKGFEEGMQYGMIGYYVPHRRYPAGYHCDPKQPLPYGGLASQKNHLSIYLMCLYGNETEEKAFREAWGKSGKKLDMGKCCIRFKKVEDLCLDILGDLIRRVTVDRYLAFYESALASRGQSKPGKPKAAPKSKPVSKAKPISKAKPAAKSQSKSGVRSTPARRTN